SPDPVFAGSLRAPTPRLPRAGRLRSPDPVFAGSLRAPTPRLSRGRLRSPDPVFAGSLRAPTPRLPRGRLRSPDLRRRALVALPAEQVDHDPGDRVGVGDQCLD